MPRIKISSDNTYISVIRVSTNFERQKLSPEAQRDSINNFINNFGGDILEEITEEFSGTSYNREALNRAISLCRDTNSILLVHKISRLSRAGLYTVSLLKENGVECIEAVSPYDSAFVKGIKFLQAEQENNDRKDNIKHGLNQIKKNILENGFHISKNGNKITSLGTPSNLTEDSRKKAAIAKRNKALNDTNNLKAIGIINLMRDSSLKSISEYLNKHGFQTSRGNKFHPSQVSNLIKLYGDKFL